MSGMFFAFSNFIVLALSKLPANYGSAAMQSVNITRINPCFLAVYLGTALCSLTTAIVAGLNIERPGAVWAVAGGLVYLTGCLFVTIWFNTPLNNNLAELDLEQSDDYPKWREYIESWLPWNHVRTVSTLVSTTAYIIALTQLRGES
ncbi:unnamed protein product [Choristocarpus tenellus]